MLKQCLYKSYTCSIIKILFYLNVSKSCGDVDETFLNRNLLFYCNHWKYSKSQISKSVSNIRMLHLDAWICITLYLTSKSTRNDFEIFASTEWETTEGRGRDPTVGCPPYFLDFFLRFMFYLKELDLLIPNWCEKLIASLWPLGGSKDQDPSMTLCSNFGWKNVNLPQFLVLIPNKWSIFHKNFREKCP